METRENEMGERESVCVCVVGGGVWGSGFTLQVTALVSTNLGEIFLSLLQ